MGAGVCRFCCCCHRKRNTVGALPEKNLKVLMLGLASSGKTELGHLLSQQQRRDYEPTNGTQYFRMQLPNQYLAITEVGGNSEMQKIWHHYFLATMGLIYCFDMSSSYEELKKSFDTFQRTLMHPYMRGKPALLVATKADLADEGVQLYDIENTFQLEELSKYYHSSVHVCYVGKGIEIENMWDGMAWLIKYLIDEADLIEKRLRNDANMKAWQDHMNKLVSEGRIKQSRYRQLQYNFRNTARRKLWYRSFGHFRAKRVRPHTAPATINTSAFRELSIADDPTNEKQREEEFSQVPNLETKAVEGGETVTEV
ncbi:ADP-ribosylation factor 5 [Eurosta solidaginis]|uniref:ADP-ribosylation factor 5 n=1 Tax=Eurosta solidaginis TaxID=178769 RepID=UPI003530D3BC